MKIKKGDTVMVKKGKDRGKSAKVIRVFPEDRRISVEGLNMFKKHVRPKRQGEKGQIISVSRPVAIANVQLICPKCGKTARVGYQFDGDVKKRVCKKCKNFVD